MTDKSRTVAAQAAGRAPETREEPQASKTPSGESVVRGYPAAAQAAGRGCETGEEPQASKKPSGESVVRGYPVAAQAAGRDPETGEEPHASKKPSGESVVRGYLVEETRSEYAEICLPNFTNTLGTMLGGHVMHLVDLCGAIAAMRHARCAVVTASVDQMTFLHPIHIGELVQLKSQVNRVFRTSMEVGVKVWVENLRTTGLRHTSSAYLTFVALDASGNRVVLPQVIPETDEERRRYEDAAERRAYRLAQKAKTKDSGG